LTGKTTGQDIFISLLKGTNKKKGQGQILSPLKKNGKKAI